MSDRLYGGWRPARGYGLGKLNERQTLAVLGAFAALLVTFILASSRVLPFAALGVVALAVALFLVTALVPAPRYGVSLGGVVVVLFQSWRARSRGYDQWESGVLTDSPRRHELPGVLAPVMPISAEDGLGRPFGVLVDRRTGRLTIALRVAPVGTVLSDAGRTDLWVGQFAEWLASLGYQPTVMWVAITVETTPAHGTEMVDYVEQNIDPSSPHTAQRILREIAAAHRGTTADVYTRVSITFDPYQATQPPADTAEAVAEVARVLVGIEQQLGLTGVSVLGRLQVWEWTHLLRSAFDPDSRAELSRLSERQELLAWADAGPVKMHEANDYLQHDSGWSVSYGLSALPQQNVASSVLAPLMVPGRYHRRVTITYQAIPADRAGEVVQKEADGSGFRKELRRRRQMNESEADRADEQRARQAAVEQAHGAGVGLWGCYVTTTVTDPRRLPEAVSDVESRARGSKLRLRRCWGWQAAGFAATLGAGVYPPELSRRGRGTR
ncbi:SCO6880 family protein [Amycolatopsis sp. NPDC051903]|uniref:SCO6880 family protein n=1 Tax=Amycolatopsis sp. NPDC051903 TaxID=3363936 RepID=UPI0037B2167B